MSYQLSLETAGAVVHAFEEFGSYQGDWIAKVTYNGETGWVQGSYGSCSVCDALQDEIGEWGPTQVGEARWGYFPDPASDQGTSWMRRDATEDDVNAFRIKLAAFGATYLDPLLTQAQIEAYVRRNEKWDSGAAEMIAFVEKNSITD